MRKNLFCLIGILLFLTSSSTAQWMTGAWVGGGVQTDGKEWKMILDVYEDNTVKVEYPDLACGGSWNLIKSKKTKSIFIENIEYGAGNCDQGCEIIVTKVNENELKLVFYLRSYDKKNPIASATLKRKM